VKNRAGVLGVINSLTIKSEATDKIEKEAIQQALCRNWSINEEDIEVNVSANRVTLSGIVDSVYQRA
jgi:osmotically-inducible protein OsmY